MHEPLRRYWRAAAISIALAIPAGSYGAEAARYPVKPVRLINPFTPGGSVDIVARGVAQKLSEAWGQPVIVDNRPGAGTTIGTGLVVRAPADGYTLLTTTGTIAVNVSLYRVSNQSCGTRCSRQLQRHARSRGR